jgi:hypothetical protein
MPLHLLRTKGTRSEFWLLLLLWVSLFLLELLQKQPVPPEDFSLSFRAVSQAVQAAGFGLLSPQLPFSFPAQRDSTRQASSADVHLDVLSFSALIFAPGKKESCVDSDALVAG